MIFDVDDPEPIFRRRNSYARVLVNGIELPRVTRVDTKTGEITRVVTLPNGAVKLTPDLESIVRETIRVSPRSLRVECMPTCPPELRW